MKKRLERRRKVINIIKSNAAGDDVVSLMATAESLNSIYEMDLDEHLRTITQLIDDSDMFRVSWKEWQ